MDKNTLINKITEELKVGIDLGYEEEHIAKNIVAIMECELEHLDYDPITNQYEWEKE